MTIGGPGWVIPGVLKMLAGALLAYLALGYSVPPDRAVDPTQMYLVAYNAVKKHLERLYVKLGVGTRTAAAGIAMGKLRQLNVSVAG